MRILLIEDNSELRELLFTKFTQKHIAVDCADNGITAFKLLKKHSYNIIIADYAMPGKNGFELCKELRMEQYTTPIIIITATPLTKHKLLAYDVGVDDYIVKPFYFVELYARVRSILRRTDTANDTTIVFDTLVVDTVTQLVSRNNVPIQLTKTEYQILHALLIKKGTYVSRIELMEKIWDNKYNLKTNSIETHMRNLRSKIESPQTKKILYCIAYRGYKIDHQK